MRQRACVRRRLAAEGGCIVDQCSHGTVHVTIGDVTLRLSREGFQSLASTLRFAVEQVAEPETKRPTLLC